MFMFAVRAKIYGVLCNLSSSIALMEHLVIVQRQKAPNFSAFHWSPNGSLVSIGQHPKQAKYRSGPNYRIGPGCAGRA